MLIGNPSRPTRYPLGGMDLMLTQGTMGQSWIVAMLVKLRQRTLLPHLDISRIILEPQLQSIWDAENISPQARI